MADVLPELIERIEALEVKANLADERYVLKSNQIDGNNAQTVVDQSNAPATKLDLANAADSVVSPNVLPAEKIGVEYPAAAATSKKK
jgi:hypothetical protein